MIKRLYDWTISLAEHPKALWALFIVSFLESSIFPIPPDVLMIPMIIAQRKKAFLIAGVCLLGSVLGALAGYAIGALAFDNIAQPIFDFYGKGDSVEEFNARFRELGPLAILIAGVTPFPFKVITIMSGAASFSLWGFIIYSIIARGLRFFLVAGLLWYWGEPIREFIEKRLTLVFILFCAILVGGFYAIRFL